MSDLVNFVESEKRFYERYPVTNVVIGYLLGFGSGLLVTHIII